MVNDLPRLVFLGTPEFALPSLEALLAAGAPILLVVTQPDRPKGRGRKLLAPPVKLLAQERGLSVYQPERIRSPEALERIAGLEPACIVTVAYGQLLPAGILEIPTKGAVNVHASLLPKYRGPAPIHWALIQGESETGVTTMLMDTGMDTGDILLQREVVIQPEETGGSLHDRLAEVGAGLLVETLELMARGTLEPKVQDHSLATYAPMLAKEDGQVDWHDTSHRICCKIRGLDPWPGAFTRWQGKRLKLFGCRALPHFSSQAKPGTVIAVEEDGLQVYTGEGSVLVKALQLEGGRPLPVTDFLRGHPLQVEVKLGE
ncbi:MAG: methionyl-tRNA formyltransferase [Deltaproteobacteria bacterium]|jgi:methionyl-tRNA formyltransferase|nr:MAG: methionyl-tRNA formyltransferase [Deltaproteobacteria bacterium]